MSKSIHLTDAQYAAVVEAAITCGFRVQRGRGGQLAMFVVESAAVAVEYDVVPPVPALEVIFVDESRSSKRKRDRDDTRGSCVIGVGA